MNITYMEHSGFYVEMSTADFLFDYFKGTLPARDEKKPLLVFVSHRHHDHYNPAIFELYHEYPNTKYILSDDIPENEYRKEALYSITKISENETRTFAITEEETIQIETLHSTDEGVAFLITYEDQKIYHAGDLNLWIWEGESADYNGTMRRDYFVELEKLRDREIDVAFVPLDPRQETDAFLGLESFLSYTRSKHIFPMHTWGNYDIIEDFLHKHPKYESNIKKIIHAGQHFVIEDKKTT